ncbi:MAG TPA: helix-turn-helix transcriptional regulator [Thermoanaerobaculia bacterium]
MRWLREKEGLRQYETARAAGITKAMLSAYETGKQRPSLPSLEKILDALGADLMAVGRALDHVNERQQRLPGPARRTGEGEGRPPEVDVRSILGVEELPREEEEALAQMLDGFYRLLRYFHRRWPG